MSGEDPRSSRSRQAILGAARDLLLEQGPAAITPALVAQRAGVGRATVYRHWPRIDSLLSDAMATVELPFFREPTSPIREWLQAELATITRELALPEVRKTMTGLLNGAHWDEQLGARRDRIAVDIAQRLAAALALAEARQELQLSVDPAHAPALLLGPLLYRASFEPAAREPDHELVDAALASIGDWSRGIG